MLIKLPIKAMSINAAFCGRRFKTKEHNQFCKDVAILLPKNQCVHGWIDVYYKFYLVNYKRTDVANLEKCLTDIIVAAGIIDDDRFIVKNTQEKFESKEDRVEVEITPR